MRVRLKGINRVRKKLADGSHIVHYYAWRGRGAPKLPGKPGSPEFMAAYNEAVAAKIKAPANTLQSVINAYQDAPAFLDKAPRTQKDYIKFIRLIEAEFGDFPLSAMADMRTRGEFLRWRDRLAIRSKRQADYAFSVLALILAWGVDYGMVKVNPCMKPKKLYSADRAEAVWDQEDEAAFLEHAPERLRLAYMLAAYTGQRQGDLLRLTWNAYDGHCIRLKQSKTRQKVTIPVAAPLKAALDAAAKAKSALTILATTRGTPWTSDGFRTEWHKVTKKAKIAGLTFHDLRGTAVTRLAVAGCSVPEIAAITGHKLSEVSSIIEGYFGRDPELAESGIKKLDEHSQRTKTANRLQTVPPVGAEKLLSH